MNVNIPQVCTVKQRIGTILTLCATHKLNFKNPTNQCERFHSRALMCVCVGGGGCCIFAYGTDAPPPKR